MTEAEREWARDNLVWAIRWVAADPEPALRALDAALLDAPIEDRSWYVPDEIALTLDDCLLMARQWEVFSPDVLAMVDEINRVFESISGQENAEYWTPMAVAESPVWIEQRDRARHVLTVMDEPRADYELPGHI